MQLTGFCICLALLFISIETKKLPHPNLPGLSNLDVIKTKLSEVEGKRHKRGIGENVDCTMQCVNKLTETIAEISDDKLKGAEATGVFSKTSATHFDEICNVYEETDDCLGECCDFPNRDEALQGLGTLDQMCVQNYDEWKSAMPCFENTEKTIEEKCHPQCGGEAYLFEQMERMNITNDDPEKFEESLKEILDALNNICNFTDCVMDCSVTILDADCAGTDASKLVKSHLANSMHMSGKQMGPMFPKSCRALTDKYEDYIAQVDYEVPVDDDCDDYDDYMPTPYGPDDDDDEGYGEVMHMTTKVLHLSLEVLEKENKKLDLEIEKLTLEKEALLKQ